MNDPHRSTPSGRTRARGLGLAVEGTPGPWNAITDVPGVAVMSSRSRARGVTSSGSARRSTLPPTVRGTCSSNAKRVGTV